ncbi:hypothetical protein BDW62DRAFT_98158 [Aspergillus aurantiobrunneus]
MTFTDRLKAGTKQCGAWVRMSLIKEIFGDSDTHCLRFGIACSNGPPDFLVLLTYIADILGRRLLIIDWPRRLEGLDDENYQGAGYSGKSKYKENSSQPVREEPTRWVDRQPRRIGSGIVMYHSLAETEGQRGWETEIWVFYSLWASRQRFKVPERF